MYRSSSLFSGLGILAASLLFAGCGSDTGPGGRCPGGAYSCGQLCEEANPPAQCMLDCSDAACPSGYYCGADDTCTADCSAANALCGDGTCNPSTGVCTPPDSADAGPQDNGPRDNGPRPDFGPPVDLGPQPDGDVCARVTVEATRVTPNVIFLVDRSGSMGWELDLSDGAQCPLNNGDRDCYANGTSSATRDLSRWRGLRSTLIGTSAAPAEEGLIADLQDQVRFGALTYTRDTGDCRTMRVYTPVSEGGQTRVNVISPFSTTSARDVIAGNGSNDGQYLNSAPSGGTPTGPAIDYLLERLASTVTSSSDPTILILATDGDPTHSDNCQGFDNYTDNPEAWSVAAVQRAHAAGIRTFVLAVADEDDLAQDHVNELANAGIGAAPNASPAAMSWRVNDVAALNTALTSIIGDEISCTIELNGSVPTWQSDPCAGGTIELVQGAQRTMLLCAPGNGWQLTGPSTVEIMGTACQQLQAASMASLDASFPCDTVIFE
jgi:hypothetical protein